MKDHDKKKPALGQPQGYEPMPACPIASHRPQHWTAPQHWAEADMRANMTIFSCFCVGMMTIFAIVAFSHVTRHSVDHSVAIPEESAALHARGLYDEAWVNTTSSGFPTISVMNATFSVPDEECTHENAQSTSGTDILTSTLVLDKTMTVAPFLTTVSDALPAGASAPPADSLEFPSMKQVVNSTSTVQVGLNTTTTLLRTDFATETVVQTLSTDSFVVVEETVLQTQTEHVRTLSGHLHPSLPPVAETSEIVLTESALTTTEVLSVGGDATVTYTPTVHVTDTITVSPGMSGLEIPDASSTLEVLDTSTFEVLDVSTVETTIVGRTSTVKLTQHQTVTEVETIFPEPSTDVDMCEAEKTVWMTITKTVGEPSAPTEEVTSSVVTEIDGTTVTLYSTLITTHVQTLVDTIINTVVHTVSADEPSVETIAETATETVESAVVETVVTTLVEEFTVTHADEVEETVTSMVQDVETAVESIEAFTTITIGYSDPVDVEEQAETSSAIVVPDVVTSEVNVIYTHVSTMTLTQLKTHTFTHTVSGSEVLSLSGEFITVTQLYTNTEIIPVNSTITVTEAGSLFEPASSTDAVATAYTTITIGYNGNDTKPAYNETFMISSEVPTTTESVKASGETSSVVVIGGASSRRRDGGILVLMIILAVTMTFF